MTREEAIIVLKNEQPHCGKKALFPEEKKYEAFDIAIKALEQEPCNDCISRQAAIDETWKEPTYTDPLNVLTEVRDRIKALPSAQPKRMPGKWKKISPASIYECSVCGQNIMTQDIDAYRYCHGCGADMRGEQDDSV